MKKINVELTELQVKEIRKALAMLGHELAETDEDRYLFVDSLYTKFEDLEESFEEEEN